MLDFINQLVIDYQDYFIWMGIVSTVVFVVSLALMPYLLGLIDENYFVGLGKHQLKVKNFTHLLIVIIKSLLGFILLVVGVIMLITPGQGLISILLGLFLVEFPNKYKWELKLIHHNPTFKMLNWLRAKANKPPFNR